MKFQIGDKVILKNSRSEYNDKIATVVKVPDDGKSHTSNCYGLDFGFEIRSSHTIDGLLDKPTGWIVSRGHAEDLMELVQRREEMEFRVGDLVEVFYGEDDYDLDREPEQGMVGTVIQNGSDVMVLVSFEGFDGHTTDEMDAWWVRKKYLKPASTVSKEFADTTKEMTEIEKLSREALDEIYKVVEFVGDDDIDDIKLIEAIIARYNSDVEQIKIEKELAKRPFQVGDIITGIEGHHYACTTEDAIMQVVDVLPKDGDYPYEKIRVKILKHKLLPDLEGEEYAVEEKHFREVE